MSAPVDPVQVPGISELAEVGRGGFGVVYRAWQEQLRRRVAVKVLTARLDGSEARGFAKETRALGTVSGHPHIVTVFDAGITGDGKPYLVMPFYEDGSLADRLKDRGPMSWQEGVQTGVQLAGALQTAHDAGILHRDIKPANVLVDGYGAPRLADFGQARSAGDEATQSVGIVATPGYSAPEILHGVPASPTSDVFSLGATIMGLIIGRGPFAGSTDEIMAALLFRVVNDPTPDLRAHGVPEPVCRALEAAMVKDPAQRTATARAFGEALQQAQREVGHAPTSLVVARVPGTEPVSPAQAPTEAIPARPVTPPSGAYADASTVRTPPGAPPSGPDRTPAYGVPAPPASGPVPAPAPSPVAPPRRRRRTALLAALVVLVVVAGGLTAFLVTRGGSSGPKAAPSPRAVSDPQALLLSDVSALGSFTTPRESDPANPGEWSIFWDLIGTAPDNTTNVSDLPTCLGLPTPPAGSQRNVSNLFVAGGSPYTGGRYLVMQTMGFVMPSAAAAAGMVEPWRIRLSGCEEQAAQACSYDDFSWLGGEKSLLPDDGQPLAPDVEFQSPTLGVTVPAAVRSAFVRVRYLLVDKPGHTEHPPRAFDLIALAAGTSVVYLVLQANGGAPSATLRVAAVRALLAKLVT